MADNVRSVSIGEIVVSRVANDVLVAYGLGSCVSISLYDPDKRVGGMLHALLPASLGKGDAASHPEKFVDLGVPLLLDQVEKLGAMRRRLIVRLCGGAHMLSNPGIKNTLNIGDRNVEAARTILKNLGLKIAVEETGGSSGRTAKLYMATGQVTVRTMGQKERPCGQV